MINHSDCALMRYIGVFMEGRKGSYYEFYSKYSYISGIQLVGEMQHDDPSQSHINDVKYRFIYILLLYLVFMSHKGEFSFRAVEQITRKLVKH